MWRSLGIQRALLEGSGCEGTLASLLKLSSRCCAAASSSTAVASTSAPSASSTPDFCRRISSSTATCKSPRFQSVVRKPVPKAKVLNVGNCKEWSERGMDVGFAEDMLQEGAERKQQASSRQAQKTISDCIHEARSVQELQLAVDQLGKKMMPFHLVFACSRAIQLGSQQGSGWQKKAHRVLEPLAQLLQPHVSTLTNGQFSHVLYAFSRSGFQEPKLVASVLQELSAAGGQRLANAQPQEVTSIMHSISNLGLHRRQEGSLVWALLTKASQTLLPTMQPGQLVHLLRALGLAADVSSPVWAQAQSLVLQRVNDWAASNTEQLASVLHSCARANALLPELLSSVEAALFQNAGSSGQIDQTAAPPLIANLPPPALASLAYAASSSISGRGLLMSVSTVAASSIVRFSASDLALLMSACARASHHDTRLMRLVSDLLRIRGVHGLGGNSAASLLGSLVLLGVKDAELAKSLLNDAILAVPSLSARSLASAMWGFAYLGDAEAASKMTSLCAARLIPVLQLDVSGSSHVSALAPVAAAQALCALLKSGASEGAEQQLAVMLADVLAAQRNVVASVGSARVTQELSQLLSQRGVLADHKLVSALQSRSV